MHHARLALFNSIILQIIAAASRLQGVQEKHSIDVIAPSQELSLSLITHNLLLIAACIYSFSIILNLCNFIRLCCMYNNYSVALQQLVTSVMPGGW